MEENNIVIEQTTGDIAGGKSINIGTGVTLWEMFKQG